MFGYVISGTNRPRTPNPGEASAPWCLMRAIGFMPHSVSLWPPLSHGERHRPSSSAVPAAPAHGPFRKSEVGEPSGFVCVLA